MDQRFSRYAIASMVLAFLVPVEFYAITRGISTKLPVFLVAVVTVATPLGAIVLGHMARGQVRHSGYIRGGYGTGSVGMILGYLYLAAFLYGFLMLGMSPLP